MALPLNQTGSLDISHNLVFFKFYCLVYVCPPEECLCADSLWFCGFVVVHVGMLL